MTANKYFMEIVDYAIKSAQKLDWDESIVWDEELNALGGAIKKLVWDEYGQRAYLSKKFLARAIYLWDEMERVP